MTKIILFNEEEYLEFPSKEDAAKFLNCTESDVQNIGEGAINSYYVEFEEDRIVQYHKHSPVKVWETIECISDTLLIHPIKIKNSLRETGDLPIIHFKYFSQTKGRPYYV
jgi:hypothetical protein